MLRQGQLRRQNDLAAESVIYETPMPTAETNSTLLYLHTPTASGFAEALELSSGMPDEVAGQPAVYLTKDLIHLGKYIHPVKKFRLDVGDKQLDTWLDNFNLMLSRGVEVPINVDHSEAADDARGWLKKVWRDNGKLRGLCQFIGEDAAKTAARNRVSVGIDPDFTDGEGRKYDGGAIRHVALTPLPVVPDQQPFTIAASRAAAGGDVLTLAAATEPISPSGQRRNTMAHKMLPCSEDTINSLHRHVPGLDGTGDEEKMSRTAQHVATTHGHMKNLMQCMGMDGDPSDLATMSRVVEAVKARHAQDIEDAGGLTAVASLSVAQIGQKAAERRKSAFGSVQEASRLRERLEEKEGTIATLSAATVRPLDPENQTSVIESANVLAEACVANGSLNPMTKDRLLSLLTKGSDGKVNTLAMSSAANPLGNGPLVLGILRALKDNKRPGLGEQSGLQALSRTAPGDKEEPADPTKKFNELVGASGDRKTVL